MKTNPEIFKAYDIRGIYGKDLDDNTAYLLGHAYVAMRRERDKITKPLRIAVGKDMRLSSPDLHRSLIKGLIETGVEVIDIGLVSTPSFYFAVANYNYDGGIIVSASHNPGEYNGFKMTREKAIPVSGETGMDYLRDKVISGEFIKAERQGSISLNKNVLEEQIKHDLKFGDISKIKPLRIVVDVANSMGLPYIEAMFKEIPCELIKMNFELDGTFPAHEADPLKEENMRDLQKRVLETKADLGIATDGDGDRIFFVDDKGKTIEQSIIRGILAKTFLRDKPGSKICYDIRPGKITRDLIEKNGGIPIITRVGHSLIKEQTIKEGGYFAGESSGHFFLNLDLGCFEMPVIMILKLLEEFSEANKPVSEYIKPYQKYFHSGEINSSVEKEYEKIFTLLAEKYSDAKISRLDGISIEYPEFWFNVRGSNTEPKLRLNLEAVSREIMEEKRDEVMGIIRS
jgi:phosphomannomutase